TRSSNTTSRRFAAEPVANRRLVVFDDRVAVRRLVACEPERVQRERILIRCRPLLLDQTAEDANLDGVGVHATLRSDAGAVLRLEVREVRLRVDLRAGRAPERLLRRELPAEPVHVLAEPVAQRGELAAPDGVFELRQ